MGGRRHRNRVEPTDEWEQLALLCGWPEQLAYEEVRPLVLFGTALTPPQHRLFRLETLGEGGWLKTLRLEDWASRRSRPGSLQQALFPYLETL